jgi:DUF971 family protein
VTNASSWPTELRRTGGGEALRVTFDDGAVFDLSAEYLRVESPSAEVRGHSPAQRKIEGGKSGVKIRDVVPVGNYAVRLDFDDGHSTGIYSWTYLRELGLQRDARWSAYVARLKEHGLAR